MDMNRKLIANFEVARTAYLEVVALLEVLTAEREQWYNRQGVTCETLENWVYGQISMPSDLAEINRAATEAVLMRGDAYQQLLDAAEAITAVIARKNRMAPDTLAPLWEHMRYYPYSPSSLKALDAILRLQL
jgi:hypothetical protein